MEYDELGPETILQVYDPETGMRGIIVLDNTVRGPAKGGIRMTPTVDEHEVRGLARAMTLKNALADLPLGGGKSGIIADAKQLSSSEKEAIVRAFAARLAQVAPKHYVAAPDIAMAETEMRWIADVAGRASITGKPTDLGGIPHELGSTGYGVYVSVREQLRLDGESLEGKTVAVQGFGNVGSFAAKFMGEDGAVCVAASDSSATLYHADGIDVEKVQAFKEDGGRLSEYPEYEKKGAMDIITMDVDVLVPAAQKNVITRDNVDDVQASLISQGANLPIPHEVEEMLEERGVRNLPDILANAGGVISSYIEHIGGKADEVFGKIEETIAKNVREMNTCMQDEECSSRKAVEQIALRRIREAKK